MHTSHKAHIGSSKAGLEAAAAAATAAAAAEQKEDAHSGAAEGSDGKQEAEERPPVPRLAICIMVAGTRGDVQPFVALGLKLQVS